MVNYLKCILVLCVVISWALAATFVFDIDLIKSVVANIVYNKLCVYTALLTLPHPHTYPTVALLQSYIICVM